MDLAGFDLWCRQVLDISGMSGIDDSLNGVQVGRSGAPLTRVAFAVDACAESISRAARAGAQVLFVHHGLFWGKGERLDGALLRRVRALLEADLALYACHLPLDKHPELGHNVVMAKRLGLVDIRPFGRYRGQSIGCAGRFPEPLGLDEAVSRLVPDRTSILSLIPAGPERIERAAIVSGGGAMEAFLAIEEGMELFVTGEASHSIYHAAEEAGMHVLAAGHYATEVWGLKALAARVAEELGLETVFIDLPTGL